LAKDINRETSPLYVLLGQLSAAEKVIGVAVR
jgi:hypothetical protein